MKIALILFIVFLFGFCYGVPTPQSQGFQQVYSAEDQLNSLVSSVE
jgi:hypothetical protein